MDVKQPTINQSSKQPLQTFHPDLYTH